MDLEPFYPGLSESTAQRRLLEDGPNSLPQSGERTILRIVLEVVREPMLLLLGACGGLYAILGEAGEAGILLVSLLLMAILAFYQSVRSERALGRLRELAAPRAFVIRDGRSRMISGMEVVRGDHVILHEGNRIPADGVVIGGDSLLVDESLLTGESAAVVKDRDHPRVFAGTVVVQGNSGMQVERIGSGTELGRIGKSLSGTVDSGTGLQQEVRKMVWSVFWLAILFSSLLAVLYVVLRRDAVAGILLGLSLAMAILPNEIPAILSIFFALGSSRMAKFGVITRNPAAIENLGTISVLCADKTGTLTLNQMSVDSIWTEQGSWSRETPGPVENLPEQVHEVMEYGVLASREDSGEPMELALHALARESLSETNHLHPDWVSVREYPIGSGWMMSRAWKEGATDFRFVGAKGAPESVLPLCSLDPARAGLIRERVHGMAEAGLRVIAVAKAKVRDHELPEHQDRIRLEFVGLIGMKDPLRAEAREFVRECESAGVRVVMMTGDHPATAASIARDLGMNPGLRTLTGADLDSMKDGELTPLLKDVVVFSRVKPEQKLRIVHLFQGSGERVAMTGDGVNDAPALRAADVGIAMGGRGTDVAREASDLVLLRDDFGSILSAIRMGRLMRENLRNAFRYLLSIHLPVVGLSILPVVMNLPLILLPVHIAFLHLWVEPVSSIAFEGEPARLPARARSPRELFDPVTLKETMFRGARILAAVLLVLVFAWYRGKGEWDTRGLAFTTLLFSNLGLLLLPVLRNSGRKFVWLGTGVFTLLSYFLLLRLTGFRELLRVNPIHPVDFLVCAGFGMAFAMLPMRAGSKAF
jgi:Ca2+-transporting ATPase